MSVVLGDVIDIGESTWRFAAAGQISRLNVRINLYPRSAQIGCISEALARHFQRRGTTALSVATQLVDQCTSPATLDATIMGLKFFFDVTLNLGELMAKMPPVQIPRSAFS